MGQTYRRRLFVDMDGTLAEWRSTAAQMEDLGAGLETAPEMDLGM